jgi:hypothetical protein
MKRSGPLLTLVTVALLGAVLFIANSVGNPANTSTSNPAATPAPPAAAQPAPAAPASPPAEAQPAVKEVVFAGWSAGKEVSVAIAVKDERAVAYICDGKKVESWLEGSVKGDQISLKGKNAATITGTVSTGDSNGTVAIAGKQWAYSAKAVEKPAGLYEGRADVRGVATRIGWIVQADGTQTGIQSAVGAEPQAAPVLDPANAGGVVVDGVPVTVTSITGGDTVIAK